MKQKRMADYTARSAAIKKEKEKQKQVIDTLCEILLVSYRATLLVLALESPTGSNRKSKSESGREGERM